MEAESSLLCSEEQANCLCLMSQMNPAHTVSSCFLEMNFNITLQCSTGLPRGLLLIFSHQNFICTSLLSSACVRAHLFFFDFIMPQYLSRNKNYGAPNYANFSSIFLLIPFTSKYPSYHPIIKNPQFIFSLETHTILQAKLQFCIH